MATVLVTPSLNELLDALARKTPEVLSNVVATQLERQIEPPLVFRPEHRSRARRLLPQLRSSHERGDWTLLPKRCGRTAFLAASVALLADMEEEWAIVGLGTCNGQRSIVREVYVRRGHRGSAGLPVSVQSQIRGHLEATPAAEIIHVHNHPPGFARSVKNVLISTGPLTSDADRAAHGAHRAVASEASSKNLSPRSVRFFLVENREIHRYWLPTHGPLREQAESFVRDMLGHR